MTRSLTRPRAALLLLALAACRPGPRPAARGPVVVAWESFPLSLDPRFGADQASQRLLSLTHQGLLRRNARLELVPDACLAWRWDTPYTELSFDLPAPEAAPPGWARFDDGKPLTAADALDTLEALRDPQLSSPKAGPFKGEIERMWIERRGSLDVLHLALKAPDPGFASNLVRAVLGIAPAGARGERLPGTGPYRLREVVPEQRIALQAKAGHPDLAAHPGVPQDLELRLMPDATTRVLALRHGTVQASLANIPSDLLPGPPLRNLHFPGANLEYVAFNCQQGPLRDPRVRRALSLALDRSEIIRGLYGGLAREAWSFYPPELPFGVDAQRALGIPGDLAARRGQAEALLDAAGFRRDGAGRRFTLRLSTSLDLQARMKALAVQAQWRAVGVDLAIQAKEFGSLLTEATQGRFEVVSLRWVGTTDPEMLYQTFHSRMVPPLGFNRGRFSDPAVDALLEQARRAPTAEARFALLRQVQVKVTEDAPYAFLWWADQVATVAPGLELDLNASGDFSGVWRRP